MSLIKSITRKPFVHRSLSWLGATYIRLVHKTGRWQTLRADVPQQFCDDGKPFITCFWHGRILMMPYAWTSEKKFHTLISENFDGRLIANIIGHFGYEAIAGSTSRGGSAAFRKILKALNHGEYVGITPDGPRGPRMRVSEGAITAARMSGAPIIPVTYSATRRHVFGSWDRFVLALPFARGVIVWGDPVYVARDASEEELAEALDLVEQAINKVTDEADALCGHAPIEPAPRPAAVS